MENTVREHVGEGLSRINAHPFVCAAHAKALTRDQALRWIFCAGRESRTFPEILKALVKSSSNATIRTILEENLRDELGNGNPEEAHFRHYLRLLRDLAISEDQFYGYDERAGIRLALSLAYNIAHTKSEATAIGYMLINEAITPVTYEAARSAITHYYPSLRTDFFDLHIAVDEHHVAELYRATDALEESTLTDLHFGLDIGERGMAVLLDEAFGIYDSYTSPVTIQP